MHLFRCTHKQILVKQFPFLPFNIGLTQPPLKLFTSLWPRLNENSFNVQRTYESLRTFRLVFVLKIGALLFIRDQTRSAQHYSSYTKFYTSQQIWLPIIGHGFWCRIFCTLVDDAHAIILLPSKEILNWVSLTSVVNGATPISSVETTLRSILPSSASFVTKV